MVTLSKGYLKPVNPDTGDIFYPALELDIQMLNDHNHDGATSQLLYITSQAIAAVNWVAAGGVKTGLYKQTVTLPGSFIYDTIDMLFKLSSGEVVYPSIERVSTTQYTIYTLDNSLAYVAFYR